MSVTNDEYRNRMLCSIIDLEAALYGFESDIPLDIEDWELVERAAAKINRLKAILEVAGVPASMIQIVMEE